MKKSVIRFGFLGLALVCLGFWLWSFGEKVRNLETGESAAVPAEPPVSTPAVAVPGDEEAVSGTSSLTERETPAVVRSGVGAAGATVRVDRKEAATGEEEADPSEADSPEARMEALARQRVDLSDPKKREEMVRAMTSIEEERMSAARERALEMGLPLEGDLPGGGRFVLKGFEGDVPIYEDTENENAAISTAANLVRSTAPFGVDGAGWTFGVWEAGGIPRVTHQEFGSPTRVTVMDSATTVSSHATHVSGTLISQGINPVTLGMAPAAEIDAYDSSNDNAEMVAAGMAVPLEAGRLQISNHSYGLRRGWTTVSGSWVWYGSFTDNGDPSDDVDQGFGVYNSSSATLDGQLFNMPYFLPFFSAGNHRNDGPPSAGTAWFQGSTSGTQRTYDPAQHPVGDGSYKMGFDLLDAEKSCKNIMTVGAVEDAVSGGLRSLPAAVLTSFSSTGPTDDGRIKPDIVANGASLVSSSSTSDTSTSSSSGTSMSSPNAAGSAMLLLDYHADRFPGQSMRASTLKGLIIHTADDIGVPGPDYRYGWGLMNTRAAAEVIALQADHAEFHTLTEGRLTSAEGSDTHSFHWNGTDPIRVTLCWTDPAGPSTTAHDSRTPRLVNDLNLRVTGPDGATYLPFVMPYVGDWSNGQLQAAAVTGINTVDNVEQVLIAAPPQWGLYTVTIDHAGSLTNDEQDYSLIITGEGEGLLDLVLTLPPSVSEGGPAGQGMVSVADAPGTAVTVTLASADPTEVTVPASVVIPAGSTSAVFDVTAVNDTDLNGTREVEITAVATGYTPTSGTVQVTDDEVAVISLNAPATLNEGDAGVAASVELSAAPTAPVEISLSSSDSTVVALPAKVTIPAGSTGPVSFALDAPDNLFAQGNRIATLTAAVDGWTADTVEVTVVDDETPILTLTGPVEVRESVPASGWEVTVNTPLAVPLMVNLASDDETELTVPATVEIPAGAFSVAVPVTVVDDLDVDGPKVAEISATAAGYAGATLPVTVQDNDVAQFALTPVASPQKRNTPFLVRVSALDNAGELIPTFSGSPTWTSDSPAGPVAFAAAVINGFSEGTADYEITVTEVGTAVELTVDDGSGHTGTSNAFDVVAVPLAGFQWSGLPTSKNIDGLINATITAVDDQGNVATGYNSPTTLEIYSSSFDLTIGSTSTSNPTTPVVRNTAHEKSRVQMIYLAEEFGGVPQWLSQVNLYSTGTGGQTMSNFKVRAKLTDRSGFGPEGFDVGGWTTVYESANQSASSTTFRFITPFFLDGVQNLMLDISFSNATSSTSGPVRVTPTTDPTVMFATGTVSDPDPQTWGNGTGPAPQTAVDRPTLGVNYATLIGELPVSPATFVNGTWTGPVYNPVLATAIYRARSPEGVSSFSDAITVFSVGAVTSGTQLYFQDFETGVQPPEWTFSGTGPFRTQVTSANTPRGAHHVTMDSATNGNYARNQADLQLDLTNRSNAMLEFYAKEFGDESHIPPPSPFTDGADFDGVAISPDGVQWAEVRSLRNINATNYLTVYRVSLDPIMRRMGWTYGPNMRIRFNQYDDQAITSDGIAFDDVRLRVNNANGLVLDCGADAIDEGSGAFDVTITAPSSSGSDRTINLNCTQDAKLQVPATVVLPAGQTSVVTQFTVLDDSFVDGWKSVRITASMSGLSTTFHWVEIRDDDGPPVLELMVPPTMAEGDPSATGILRIIPPPANTTEVEITFSDSEQMTGSVGLTYSAGRENATFTVTPLDDTILDGTQTVTVTARELLTDATGSAVIEVLDNDTGAMTLALPASVREGGAAGIGTVNLSAKSLGPVTIALGVSDPSQATVPSSVVVPAGQLSANFQILAVDDADADEIQSVTVVASHPVYGEASADLDVEDNDPTNLAISPVASPQTRSAPFTITVTAQDASGATLTGFEGSAVLSAEAGGVPVPLEVLQEVRFVNGIWTGEVAVGATASNVTVSATIAGGASGTSNPFDVQAGGAAVELAFATVPSPQAAGAAIPVIVSAVDAAGVRVHEITGPVLVELATDPAGWVVTSTTLNLVEGRAETTLCIPVPISSVILRGTAGTLTGQGAPFEISPVPVLNHPPQEVLFEDDFESGLFAPEWTITGTGTHRTEVTTANGPRSGSWHMTMDSSVDVSNARNEATLMLNLEGKSDVVLSFWMKESGDEDHGPPTMPFITGADFDGVAISEDGNAWYEVQGLRSTDGISGNYTLFNVNLSDAAATHGLTLNSAFRIRFNHWDNYTYGTDGFAFDDVRVVANGSSPVAETRLPVFADDFESGVWKPEWTITGTGNSRTEVTTLNTPRAGNYHLVMDANPALNSRNEATLTLDLTGLDDIELRFWMKENADEDHAPPSNPFTGGADYDGVAVSADGNTWHEIQALRGSSVSGTYQEFVIDLSSGAQAAGLTFNDSFKIRFNHFDNSPWPNGDGFAFDDISVTARATNALTLNLPPSVPEAGSVSATVSLGTVRAVDTIVTLTSNRPDCVTLPATVTIPAGATESGPFDLTIPDDALLTGTLLLDVRVEAAGLQGAAGTIQILDNDAPASWALTLPSSLDEGATINGTIEIAPASAIDLPVVISASPSAGLVFPSTLILPAGQSSVGFSVERPENMMVLEAASVEFSATLGATTDSVVVSTPDNDVAVLVLTLPASVRESDAPTAASVGFQGSIVQSDLEVSLSSSDGLSLGVPASVTIPAGSGTAVFDVTPIDNAAQDGSRTVTVTASTTVLPDVEEMVQVLDDEPHHLSIDPIPSPQVALVPFDLTVRVLTIDGTAARIEGMADLTASAGGGAATLTPMTSGTLTTGVWTGPVTLQEPNVEVEISASIGGFTAVSNPFDVELGPRIGLAPGAVSVTVPAGEVVQRSVTVSNTGTRPLDWSVEVVPVTDTVDDLPLEGVLEALNDGFSTITDLIPNRYDFLDGVTGTNIPDGGGDMYDSGNYLRTSVLSAASSLTYSDNVIVGSTGLGVGGRYFTRKHPGLFAFAADLDGIEYFEITGNLGADGSGSTDTALLTRNLQGSVFKGFVKRVFGAGDPSVNHLMIVRDAPTLNRTTLTTTQDEDHRLSGLSGTSRIYYFLFASASGGYINDAQMEAIFDAALEIMTGPAQWLTIAPASGSVAAAGNQNLEAHFDATGLDAGAYAARIVVRSNDPSAPEVELPVTMTVGPAVDHFEWSVVPSPQQSNTSFPVTLTARDDMGGQVASFEGSATLGAFEPLVETTSGTGTGTNSFPFHGSSYENRSQAIYLPSEIGPAGQVESLGFEIASVPGPLSQFTIRLKHTALPDYSDPASRVWETEGWTTVFQGTLTAGASGWLTVPLNTPFEYDGVSNLIVDVSYDNQVFVSSGSVRVTGVSTGRNLYSTQYGTFGAPASWSGTTPTPLISTALTNVQFRIRRALGSTPSIVSFTNGLWSGSMSVLSSGAGVSLVASHTTRTGVTGESNTFDVTSVGGLTLSAPTSGTEGDSLFGAISLSAPAASNVVVSLASDDTSEMIVPATVTIFSGNLAAGFPVTLVDDAVLDGTRTATLTASALAYDADRAEIQVADNETTTVAVTLPASVSEGGAMLAAGGTVSLGVAPSDDVTLQLVSSDTTELTVPSTIVVPAGQLSATFAVQPVNDFLIDGDKTVTVTATLPGSAPGDGTIVVTDNETRSLSLSSSISVREGAGTLSGTVWLSYATEADLVIDLSSSDTSEVTVPGQVTIPGGYSSQPFVFTVVNDAEKDGSQAVTLTASAPSFAPGTGITRVYDDEVDHFALATVPSPQIRGAPFTVRVTAQSVDNFTVTEYQGTPDLSAADGGSLLAVSPVSSTGFVNGFVDVPVTVNEFASAAILTVNDSLLAATGSSNPFAVEVGSLHHFSWSTIPSPQIVGDSFNATITAVDIGGNTVPDFAGSADLFVPEETVVGTSTSSSSFPYDTIYHDVRTQIIVTAAELGGAKRLMSLALDTRTLPARTLTRHTIRLKHTAKTDYLGTGNAVLDPDGWTVCRQGDVDIDGAGWYVFEFTTPFDYDGSSNLMVDLSFDNAGTATSGSVSATLLSAPRLAYSVSNSTHGDPLGWGAGSSPPVYTSYTRPNLLLVANAGVSVSPSNTGAFTAGVWTGPVEVADEATGIQLMALGAGVVGWSNVFDVESAGAVTLNLASTTGGEGSGALNGTVEIPAVRTTDVIVTLGSSSLADIAPSPGTVTIPAGATSIPVTFTIIDDADLEGTETVQLTASAVGYDGASADVVITDNETAVVSVGLPVSASEGAGTLIDAGTVSLSLAPVNDLTVTLESSDTDELTVPASVMIAAGASSSTFSINAVDDTVIDGDQDVTVTATLAGSLPGTALIAITDDESNAIALTVDPTVVVENAGVLAGAGTLQLAAPVEQDVTFAVSSNDTSEIASTAVQILAGESQGSFDLVVVDDGDFDGTQVVTLTAGATGFADGIAQVSVLDDDVHHFTLSAVPATVIRNGPFSLSVTAADVNGVPVEGYAGTPDLTAAAGGSPISLQPASVTGFADGGATIPVTIDSFATGVMLTVIDSALGVSGTSNAFDVVVGPASEFRWSAIPSPQEPGVAFPVTISTFDAAGNAVADFEGMADLSVEAAADSVLIGTGGLVSSTPLQVFWPRGRSQQIQLASDIGQAGRITSLAMMVTSLPGTATLTDFTIRLKHTAHSAFASSGNVWETTDFVTVFQGDVTISTTGEIVFPFATPFFYDGVSNLMVDYSFRERSGYTSNISVAATIRDPSVRPTVSHYSTNPYLGDPLGWSGSSPLPGPSSVSSDIRLGFSTEATVSPATTPAFANGVWSGMVTVHEEAPGVKLRATSGIITGVSNTFDVWNPVSLSIDVASEATEGAGSINGTVRFSRPNPLTQVVTLSSSNQGQIEAPDVPVVIPAGALSASFSLNVIQNSVPELTEDIVIEATTASMLSASAVVHLKDDDAGLFSISSIGTSQIRNVAFPFTVAAQTLDGELLPSYAGSPTIEVKEGMTSLTASPTGIQASSFSNGVAPVSLTVSDFADGAVAVITDPVTGGSGTSNTFAVGAGAPAMIEWSPVPSTVYSGVPFSASLTVRDVHGNPVKGLTEPVSVTIPESVATGTPGYYDPHPLFFSFRDYRMQMIYHASELSGAMSMHSITLKTDFNSQRVFNGMTIRMKSTAKGDFDGPNGQWEDSGWTVVYQGSPNFPNAGTHTIPFTSAFEYDGTSNVMVDLSYDDPNYVAYNDGVIVEGTLFTQSRAFYAGRTDETGSPLTWDGSNVTGGTYPWRPNLTFNGSQSIPIVPNPLPMVDGQWTGDLTLAGEAAGITLTATVGGLTATTNIFDLLPPPDLQIQVASVAVEGDAPLQAVIELLQASPADLMVSLSSDSPDVVVPPSVLIPAGQMSANFAVQIVNDSIPENLETVTLTASASGLTPATAEVNVEDDDPGSYEIAPIGLVQRVGESFRVDITAKLLSGSIADRFNGMVALSAAASGAPVGLSPTVSGSFAGGVWSGDVTGLEAATEVVLTATDAQGSTGSSNAFEIRLHGPLDHFEWQIGGGATVGVPVPARLIAKDEDGYIVESFEGTAVLAARQPVEELVETGNRDYYSSSGFQTNLLTCRMQAIYLPEEVGGARTIRRIGFWFSGSSTIALDNFNLRLKHTSQPNYETGQPRIWEDAAGFVTAFSGVFDPTISGAYDFVLAEPFEYNGTDHLMVDISFYQTSASSSFGNLAFAGTSGFRRMFFNTNSNVGNPLSWSGSSPSVVLSSGLPVMRFLCDDTATFSPNVTGSFSNGVWNGSLTFSLPHPATVLVANSGGRTGLSPPVAVTSMTAPLLDSEPMFTGGLANMIAGTLGVGAATHEIEVSPEADFANVIQVLTGPVPSGTATGLSDGQMYHYRARGLSETEGQPKVRIWAQVDQDDFTVNAFTNASPDSLVGDVTLAVESTQDVVFTENFDGSPSDWSGTIFSDFNSAFAPYLTIDALSTGPDWSPGLPVNQGGDLEGVLAPGGPSTKYARMPDTESNRFSDGEIEGYFGFESDAPTCYGGLMLRSGSGSSASGYLARVAATSSGYQLLLLRMTSGASFSLTSTYTIPGSGGGQNLRLKLMAEGPNIGLKAWTVFTDGSNIIEVPVTFPNGTDTMGVVDYAWPEGRAGVYAFYTSTTTANKVFIDDVKVTKRAPTYVTSGSVSSVLIEPPYVSEWGTLEIDSTTGSATGALSVDVLDRNGQPLMLDVSNGTSLAPLGAEKAIQLRANLSLADATAAPPVLRSWKVDYDTIPSGPIPGPWSNVVSSTQDASPPVIAMNPADEKYTAQAQTEIGGTAADAVSGVASVMVDGAAASTADGFANWTKMVSGLAPGSNTVTIEAADNAVPPNTASVSYHIFRIENATEQTNANGVPDLLNHALHLDAPGVGRHGLPAAVMDEDPEDGKTYLTLQYRRRINRAGFRYIVETSGTLAADGWDDTGASVEETGVTPNADGVTETVTVRITPAIGDADAKFVRLRVEVD